MWYRKIILAEQGMFDPKTSTGQSLKSLLENIISNSYENDVLNLETLNKNLATSELKEYVSKFVPEYGSQNNARYDQNTKTMYLKLSLKKEALISFAKHELIHGADPRLKQVGPGKKFKTIDEMNQHYGNQWEKSGRSRYYDPLEVTAWRQQFEDAFDTKNLKAIYDNFYKNVPNGEDLFKKELKEFIDSLRNFSVNYDNALLEIDLKFDENPNLNQSIEKEIFDKYKLNPKSISKWTKMVQKTSGIQISEAIYGIKDPKFYSNLNKYLSNKYVYLEYILKNLPIPTDPLKNTDRNRYKSLVRKENLVQPGVKSNPKFNLADNANAIKSREAFFGKASQIEALAAKNPKAWERFINSNFAMRMISGKIYNLFKGVGSGSKSLSQSIRGLNMNSPYWALLEPALEFGLYQFGLFLENPSAYSLETPEQKTIKDLSAKVNEILADNKISDKRGYFLSNYGSYLKSLGSMEQNQILSKFPVMGFNQFQNIGRNIGQR
jgi:hypothetical protein